MIDVPVVPAAGTGGPPRADGAQPTDQPHAEYDAEPGGHEDAGAGWTPEHVQSLADYFATTPGVSESALDHAREWWTATYAGGQLPPERQRITHGYDFRAFNFAPEDLPYVHSLGNAMHAAGASAEEVYALIDRYLSDFRPRLAEYGRTQARELVAAAREVEALDKKHRDEARGALRAEWGWEYARNIQAINHYLDSLPAALREEIESEVLDDGRLALNDPARLRELAAIARNSESSGSSSVPRAQRGAATTREEIEDILRTDRPRYNRSPELQERYLELIRAGDSATKPLPSDRSAINAEIADLERLMRTDRKKYNAAEGRYRDLLRIRDGQNR